MSFITRIIFKRKLLIGYSWTMIELTNPSGKTLFLNPDLIKVIEESGDTVITLLNGERILVQESPDMVQVRMLGHKKRLFETLCCDS